MTRLRSLFVWAGVATLGLLSILAAAHLLADLVSLRAIPGGWLRVVVRLAPVGLVAAAGLGLAVFVASLTGSTRRREQLAIAIGFVVLVALRILVAWQLDGVATGEPRVYLEAARSLGAEWDFQYRPMGYTIALAGALLVGDERVAVEGLNVLLALAAGGLVLALARGLYGPRAGALALLGYAVWPAGALMTVVAIPHIAFDLATVAAAWAAVALAPGWRGGLLTGALVGLSQYFRPTAPVMLPAYILARLWQGGSRRALVIAVLAPILAFVVVLVPVLVYNAQRTGELSISTSDYGGHALYIGTYEPSGGMFDEAAHDALVELAGPDPVDWGPVGTRIALERIRADPLGIAALGIRKQDTLWGTEHFGVQYGISHRLRDRAWAPAATLPMLLSQGFYVLVLVTSTAGLWVLRRRPDALVPLVVTTIWIVSAMHALVEVRDRHHAYVIPLLLPLSALALATAWGALARRLRRAAVTDPPVPQ